MTTQKKSFHGWLRWLILLLIAFAIFLFFLNSKVRRTKGILSNFADITNSQYAELFPYILAMSKHETDNFRSFSFKNRLNLFGMGTASQRTNQPGYTRPGEYLRTYESLADSVRDLIYYFDYVKFPASVSGPDQFAHELKIRGYYQDTEANYSKGIKRFL